MARNADRRPSRSTEVVVITILAVCAGYLLFYNLQGYPPFLALDEAYRLQLPRNLVQRGAWGILTADGPAPYWRESTGPTVLLPVALAFRWFAESLVAARLVIATMAAVCLAALYASVRHLYGFRIALVSVLLFLFLGPTWLNSVVLARSVYGEVPGIAFFLIGSLFWFRAVEQARTSTLVVASVFFGLATLSKDLLLVGIAGAFVAITLVDRIWTHALPWRYTMAPIAACLVAAAGWFGFQSLVLQEVAQGGANAPFAALLVLLQGGAGLPALWEANLRFLAENGLLVWGVPAVIYGLLAALRSRDPVDTHKQLLFTFFTMAWMLWFIFISLGWPRYAYPGWAILAVLIARFGVDLADYARTAFDQRFGATTGRMRGLLRGDIPVWILLAILIAWPAQNTARRVAMGANDAAVQFAEFIDTNVPADQRVLSGEWDVSFHARHTFVPIPFSYLTQVIDSEQIGLKDNLPTPPPLASLNLDYVVDGPENKHLHYVSNAFLQERGELVTSIGDYDLYRIEPGSGD